MSSFLLLFALLSRWGVSLSLADEPTAIGTIWSQAESYQLHTVTLRGTVRQVHVYPPRYVYRRGVLYGSYTFLLEDATGTIDVDVRGDLRPGIVKPVSEGDPVEIRALIYGSLGQVGGEDRPMVRALAVGPPVVLAER